MTNFSRLLSDTLDLQENVVRDKAKTYLSMQSQLLFCFFQLGNSLVMVTCPSLESLLYFIYVTIAMSLQFSYKTLALLVCGYVHQCKPHLWWLDRISFSIYYLVAFVTLYLESLKLIFAGKV